MMIETTRTDHIFDPETHVAKYVFDRPTGARVAAIVKVEAAVLHAV